MLDSHFQDAKDICWTDSAATCLMCQIWLSRGTLAFSCVESACQRDGEKLPRASCAWRKLSFAHRRSCTLSTEKDFACLQPYPILYKFLAGTTAYRTKRTKAPFLNHYPVRRWALLGGECTIQILAGHAHISNRQTQCKFWCHWLYADLSWWSPVPPRVDGWQD